MSKNASNSVLDAIGRCNLLFEHLGCWGVLNRYAINVGTHRKQVFFFTYKPHKEKSEYVGHMTWGEDGIFFKAVVDVESQTAEPLIITEPHVQVIANDEAYAAAVGQCFIELAKRLSSKKKRKESGVKSKGRRGYQPPELNARPWGETISTHADNVKLHTGSAFDEVFAGALLNLTNQGIVCKGANRKKKTTSKR